MTAQPYISYSLKSCCPLLTVMNQMEQHSENCLKALTDRRVPKDAHLLKVMFCMVVNLKAYE